MSIFPASTTNSPGPEYGARVWNHSQRQLLPASRHDAAVKQYEAALTAVQRSADPFDRHVTRRALDFGHGRQHLALAGGFQIPLELFVDRHPAQSRTLPFVLRH